MTPKSILVATDLTSRCDRALDRAVQLAAAWRAKLVALHVLEEREAESSLPSWRRVSDPQEAARARVRRDLRLDQASDLEVDVVVERGNPAERIVEVVERNGCGLVLTGVGRDELLGRESLGATVNTLLRAAGVPILVVKSRPHGPYRDAVVATDFSEASRRALETALALWPDLGITLLHGFGVIYEGFLDDKMSAREDAARKAQEECRAFLAATPAASGRSIAALCEYGDPATLLFDLAQARDIDLVVLGTEGRRGVAQLFLGSVAERVATQVPVDVLLVRRPRA